jgi:hypothetical protein
MPIRFNSPGLGGSAGIYLPDGTWEVGLAYRRLTADQWLVGRQVREEKAPFGQPLLLDINSLDFSASYALTDRLSVTGWIPFSSGTHSRYYGDGSRHEVGASGLADITVTGQAWLWNPGTHRSGNVALGLGVKTPSGKHDVTAEWYVPGGAIRHTVDQSIQLGDGGWGILLQAHGWRQMFQSASVYGFASYLAAPRNQTDVVQAPSGVFSQVHVSVPDVFQTRGGIQFPLSARAGLAAKVGGRFDGIPMDDLIGGSDGFRRPALIGYLDLGLSLTRNRMSFSLEVPIRAFANFRPSQVDRRLGTPGGGDLANYLIVAGYTYRLGRPTPQTNVPKSSSKPPETLSCASNAGR